MGCKYCDTTKSIRNKINTLEFADGIIIDESELCVSLATGVIDNLDWSK